VSANFGGNVELAMQLPNSFTGTARIITSFYFVVDRLSAFF